jgi:hypothetical protein
MMGETNYTMYYLQLQPYMLFQEREYSVPPRSGIQTQTLWNL